MIDEQLAARGHKAGTDLQASQKLLQQKIYGIFQEIESYKFPFEMELVIGKDYVLKHSWHGHEPKVSLYKDYGPGEYKGLHHIGHDDMQRVPIEIRVQLIQKAPVLVQNLIREAADLQVQTDEALKVSGIKLPEKASDVESYGLGVRHGRKQICDEMSTVLRDNGYGHLYRDISDQINGLLRKIKDWEKNTAVPTNPLDDLSRFR